MDLKTTLGELELRNPVILASGVVGAKVSSIKRVWKAGAGAVVSKSICKDPREEYPSPRLVKVKGGLLNAMGLPNPGVEKSLNEFSTLKKEGVTVIASVFGNDEEEFASVSSKVERNVGAIELNLSCPHAGSLWIFGHSPQLSEKVIEQVKKNVKIPVWVKLPGNTHISNFVKVSKTAESAGADALVISNTFPAIAIDPDTGETILGHGIGGLSGPAIKHLSLRLVYESYKETEIPIIGCGGITGAKDVMEYLYAGASAVQVGTGAMRQGIQIFDKICDDLRELLEEKEIKEIKEIVGLTHSL